MFEDPTGFFEIHLDPMLVIDRQAEIVLKSNRAACILFGYSAKEFDHLPIKEIGIALEKGAAGTPSCITFLNQKNTGLEARTQDIRAYERACVLVTFRDFSCSRNQEQPLLDKPKETISEDTGSINQTSIPKIDGPFFTKEITQHLSEMINGMSDGFMTLDKNSNFTFLNNSAEDLLGRTSQELIGRNIWEEFPETIGSRFHTEYVHALAKAERASFVQYSDILKRTLAITAYPTEDGLAVFCRDVSQQHARDQQLALLEAAVSHLNDIVLIFTPDPIGGFKDARIVFVNTSFLRQTGYSSEEIIGQSPQILTGPGTQTLEMKRINAAIRNSSPARSEFINYTKSGQPYWVEMEIVPINTTDHHVKHWVAVQRNISDRKSTEESLVISEERFQLISMATKVVIWDCDLQTDTIWWNDNLFDVFGHEPTAHEERATWWDENLHPEEKIAVQEKIQAFVDSDATLWELHYRFLKSDNTYAHVSDKGTIIRDAGGKAIRILGSMNDVSDQIQFDEQLRQSQKLEAIGQLTGGVAHDFNNLLAVVLGNLELLQLEIELSEFENNNAHKLIESGKTAVLRGADLANSMLAYARKSQLEPKETNLTEVVLETEKWMRRTIQRNVEIEMHLQKDLWGISVDPSSLQNAIINLLVNSRDALEDGGKLEIRTQNIPAEHGSSQPPEREAPKGDHVMLEISDNGVGMDQATLDQIFTPFFTTKPIGKGSGLGLSMVQGFVKQSGGTLAVHSKPGQGTRVKLFFKAILDNQDEKKSTQETTGKSKGMTNTVSPSGKRILLAEDETEVMAVLQRILENEGYSVTTAKSGDQGYELFKSNTDFDLILTDITMPGELQGDGLARACRRIRPNVPVIFLSGYAMKPGSAKRVGETGDIRLVKPVLRNVLLEAVADTLSNIPISK